MIIVCSIKQNVYSQDTVYFDNKGQFYQFIKYGFMDSYWLMPRKLTKQIKSVYKTIDFSRSEIACQNRFGFLVDLDSCGVIINSRPLKNKIDYPELAMFEKEVNSIIQKSQWQIDNIAELKDTIFVFTQLFIFVETSCDPDEILIAPKDWSPEMINILAYRKEDELIVFDYFKNRCSGN
jgi:hypothetical protein